MAPIADNLKKIGDTLTDGVSLVAVSKTKPESIIREAYDAGHRDFGENRIQELVNKQPNLPGDVRWHMIGHLQRNKVKYIAEFVHLIHGVDSYKTLAEIDKQARKHNRVIDCLLQVKIASEDSKFGLSPNDLIQLLTDEAIESLTHIRICGLMGMASFTDDMAQIREEFKGLKVLFDQVKHIPLDNVKPTILSMGMSGDYTIAIEEGSTMVRIGSAIFGHRNY
jgi:pyridoxal phosphate enzyme (YggS family)